MPASAEPINVREENPSSGGSIERVYKPRDGFVETIEVAPLGAEGDVRAVREKWITVARWIDLDGLGQVPPAVLTNATPVLERGIGGPDRDSVHLLYLVVLDDVALKRQSIEIARRAAI